jgi:hypothetical protein
MLDSSTAIRNLKRKILTFLTTLYIKISKGYTPPYSIEKNYLIATKKRNLLVSKEDQHNQLT